MVKIVSGPAAAASDPTLVGILEDFDDSRCLLMWSDFAGDVANAAWANRTSFDIGCNKLVTGGGTMNQETANSGGLIYLNTSSDGSGSQAAIVTYEGGPADYAKDPRMKFKCNFEAANSALQAQGGGFHDDSAPIGWDETDNDCAMFRSVTTGNLFAVTGSGSAETTTDLGSVYTLGNNAIFEIVSSGNGTSWAFKIDGTTRATHTSNLPDAKMKGVIGIANNTTTALRIDNLDYIWATQDRT